MFTLLLSLNCMFSSSAIAHSTYDAPTTVTTSTKSNTYFLEEVAEVVAFLAHPTSEIYSTSVSSSGSSGTISVTYKSAWTGDYFDAKFKIRFGFGKVIKSVDVISDEAFLPAFTATTFVKEILEDILMEDEDTVYEAVGVVESYIGKTVDEFDGEDFCLFILNCISLSL